ncbi:hypothetical protein [Sphingomonas koreensis]
MAKPGKIEANDKPLTPAERRAVGEAHFETSVFNVPGRTAEVHAGVRDNFGRAYAEITRPFGGR